VGICLFLIFVFLVLSIFEGVLGSWGLVFLLEGGGSVVAGFFCAWVFFGRWGGGFFKIVRFLCILFCSVGICVGGNGVFSPLGVFRVLVFWGDFRYFGPGGWGGEVVRRFMSWVCV